MTTPAANPGKYATWNGKEQHLSVRSQIEVNQGPVLGQLATARLGIAQLPDFMVEGAI